MGDSIYKVGALIFNEKKQLLVVRKLFNNRREFIIPGGKQENDENDQQTLIRELKEELGVSIKSSYFFGKFEGQAVFENIPLVMNIYQVEIDGQPSPQSEIQECLWIDRNYEANGCMVGLVLSKQVIPTLISKGWM